MKNPEHIKALVRGEYGQAARQAKQGGSSCCTSVGPISVDAITGIYTGQTRHKNCPKPPWRLRSAVETRPL